ncbi:hypothetical protein CPJCM30710_14890 [Clostridium polyendosporum]|uniref:AttH domain-containing protein n=1 Tax=Clostridium polyendosporum TaxID=69208 RepID=A0A919S1D5_9CLOT|nr:lipocalin family protein [Clostridium polyendosporum]GIM28823.1 hypothetical protein CPJCM30710_14890 [Clostridium polyendosporum]
MFNEKSNILKKVFLPKDTGSHLCSNLEWWYCFAFLDGNAGSKYAVVISFFNVGYIPFLKGRYLIFSLINLKDNSRKNFSFLNKNLVCNLNSMFIPYYLLHCTLNKKLWRIYQDYIKLNISPDQLMEPTLIEKDPTRLIYRENSLEFIDEKSGQFNVHIKEQGLDINLIFTPTKPAALIGGDGKPDELYYYSFTNNEVHGSIVKNNLEENVSGSGWFDHQWGFSKGLIIKTGWNWFGLQLDDGRELVINEFRSIKTGKTFSPLANLIEKDGSLKFTTNVCIKPRSFWKSPDTGVVYPQNWSILIPEFSMNVKISPNFPEQEMPVVFPLQAIWEGACSVSVREALPNNSIKLTRGKGFMELVGYANFKCKTTE